MNIGVLMVLLILQGNNNAKEKKSLATKCHRETSTIYWTGHDPMTRIELGFSQIFTLHCVNVKHQVKRQNRAY